jgi:hypothetical protein
MATGAAWLNGKRLTERRKKNCALTSTGLLMEGLNPHFLLQFVLSWCGSQTAGDASNESHLAMLGTGEKVYNRCRF